MDWRRAKLLLIAGFALLDVFLSWRVVAESALVTRVPARVRPTVRLGPVDLSSAGVELAPSVHLPADAPPMPLLSVRLQVPDGKALAGALFGEAPVQVRRWPSDEDPQAEIYQTSAETLAVLREGLVRYQRLRPDAGGVVDPGRARSQAADFVARAGGLPPGGIFDYAGPDPSSGHYSVRYLEVYDGQPLFPGYWRIDLDRTGVVAAERFWLDVNPLGQGSEVSRPTVTAGEALVRLAGALRASPQHPIQVIGVARGYYSQTYVAAREWQLAPVWRVRLSGGSTYFVNAYTGLLEE